MTKMVLALVLAAGCATTPCPTAHRVASSRGMVLECYKTHYRDTGEEVDACTIVPKRGKPYQKIILSRHCGL
jgi:hypothetical protein